MPLARIISRSQLCSRELAIDLLARGYTVEIVSPEAIPDNIADLELRVESGPDNVLTASVEAHNGAHSTSLEFVHHLKAPMVDFIRRPPEPSQEVPFPMDSASLKAEQDDSDNVAQPVPRSAELPVFDALRAHEPVLFMAETAPIALEIIAAGEVAPVPEMLLASEIPAAPEMLPAVELSRAPETVPSIAPSLVAAFEQVPFMGALEMEEAAQLVRPVVTIAAHKSEPSLKKRPGCDRTGAWVGRTALSFAAVVVVAAVLGFGIRHDATSSPSNSVVSSSNAFGIEEQPVAVLAAAPATSLSSAAPEHLPVAAAAAPKPRNPERKPVVASKKPVMTAKATPAKRRHQNASTDVSDLVAPNTVVYYGKAGSTSVAKQANHHGTRPLRQGDGVIADSKAPDLGAKTTSKAPQQK